MIYFVGGGGYKSQVFLTLQAPAEAIWPKLWLGKHCKNLGKDSDSKIEVTSLCHNSLTVVLGQYWRHFFQS